MEEIQFQSGRVISESELIINKDGSVFHLHVLPGQISDKIVLVGDPDRVTVVGNYFDTIECDVRNREFHTITGMYKGKRLTVVSHGIGPDNIDIVLTELDALFNVNFQTRQANNILQVLTLIRIGTSGSLQPYLPVGSHCISEISIGLDTVLAYYKDSQRVFDEALLSKFVEHVAWNPRLATLNLVIFYIDCYVIKFPP
jgi:uridine phosphorylase